MAHRNRGFTVFKEGEFSVRKSQTLSSSEAKNSIMGRRWYKETMRICMRFFSWCVWKMTDPKWPFYDIFTIWLFNIAMENSNHKWRFLEGKIIYFYGPSIPCKLLVITRGKSDDQPGDFEEIKSFFGPNKFLRSSMGFQQGFGTEWSNQWRILIWDLGVFGNSGSESCESHGEISPHSQLGKWKESSWWPTKPSKPRAPHWNWRKSGWSG